MKITENDRMTALEMLERIERLSAETDDSTQIEIAYAIDEIRKAIGIAPKNLWKSIV